MTTAELRDLYYAMEREKERRDPATREAYVRQESFREGEKQGFQNGEKSGIFKERLEIITNMIRNGFSVENISKVTGISLGEVEALAAQIS